MTITPLPMPAINEALATLPGWTYDAPRKAIHRRIVLKDFGQALALMVRIGVEAEKRDHHPEWTNVYNRLDIWLTTHDADGVSTRDLDLARRIDELI
ncbi:4a-hydroxytetrahydrobiopterin dehydratase [Novosphingobium sp. SG751A]|uniref:4a-hydroxytetrahydrobiopterin dehydratase n=1 Tax=Novosphingobium sp. SG751A TaxID=2587000 RepID=UPI001C12AC46|nr:4a-hydroxytetrahydrobiopterin dehydratase [Novosphingobium sp. SG751A]NOW45357.1 4a-hydroxytetrahydrobiopterin dehydratase [Novosphingobium sp. SG751A]